MSDEEKTTKLGGVSSTGEFWISHALSTVRKLEATSKYITLLCPLDDEDGAGVKLVDKAEGVLEKLKTVRSRPHGLNSAADLRSG